MKIVEIQTIPLNIPFRRTLELSSGIVGSKNLPGEHVYVKLVTSKGLIGWGEARPSSIWKHETRESICSTVEKRISPILKESDPEKFLEYEDRLNRRLSDAVTKGEPFARNAVETAIMDLLGKAVDKPIHSLLGGKRTGYLELAYVISVSEKSVEEEVKTGISNGFRLFKVKISGDVEHDAKLLRLVSGALGEQGSLCADANEAYNVIGFNCLLSQISDIGNLSFIEQPLQSTATFELKERFNFSSKISIALDESIFSSRDLFNAIHARDVLPFSSVVLKIAKSGFKENQRIVALAEANDVGLLGSGMTESGVGLAAAAHLFSTVVLKAPADLNGPQFLSSILTGDLLIRNSKVRIPDRPGLGITVDENKVEEFRTKKICS
jgi:muconate cycloisomerase